LISVVDTVSRMMLAVRQVLQTAALLFGWIPASGRFSRNTYVAIHLTFIVTATLILAWISPRVFIPGDVFVNHWFVQRFYLGIMFFLFYMFIRLLIASIQLFLARDTSEFKDIDQAFDAGLEALAREGYHVLSFPVFVVCGATADQLKNLFTSTRFAWKVIQEGKVLTFLACDEALFIGLNDVGAMSQQLHWRPTDLGRRGPTRTQLPTTETGYQATLKPGQVQQAAQTLRRPEPARGSPEETLKPGAIAAVAATLQPSALRAAVGAAGPNLQPAPLTPIDETMRPGGFSGVAKTSPAPGRQSFVDKLSSEELQRPGAFLSSHCHRTRLILPGQRIAAGDPAEVVRQHGLRTTVCCGQPGSSVTA